MVSIHRDSYRQNYFSYISRLHPGLPIWLTEDIVSCGNRHTRISWKSGFMDMWIEGSGQGLTEHDLNFAVTVFRSAITPPLSNGNCSSALEACIRELFWNNFPFRFDEWKLAFSRARVILLTPDSLHDKFWPEFPSAGNKKGAWTEWLKRRWVKSCMAVR